MSETAQKLVFVAVLGGLVASASWLSRSPKKGAPLPTTLKTIPPSVPTPPVASTPSVAQPIVSAAPIASAPPIGGTPLDRLIEVEIPSTGCSKHQFGEALAATNDTLFVGAPWRDYAVQKNKKDDLPAACLYRRLADTFSLTQRLVADVPKLSEGYARGLALTDGFAVVGSAGHENGDGPTHDYTRSPDAKASLRALLEEPSGENEVFAEYGAAVASDERMVLVGAHLHHETKCDGCGAVFVFRRNAPKGTKPTMLLGENPGENLGTAVAISGELVVIGAAGYYSNGNFPGAAVVLRVDGDTFHPVCRLPGRTNGEEYGASVAVDGRFVVVGANGTGHGSSGLPRFTVHEVKGDTCIARGEFSSAGASVAISGSWIAAGQPWFDGGAIASGRVGLFHLDAEGSLEHRAWLLPKRVLERAWFGASVALTAKHVFAGAPGMRDDGSAFVGAARL